MNSANNRKAVETMVLGAILTALVIILQLMGAFIRFGPFSVSLVLIPIVIGAATCGTAISTWLGLVFGIAVLLSGDAAAFLAVNVPGTIITVIAKGVACGFFASLAYKGMLRFLDTRSSKHIQKMKKEYGLCEQCEPGVYKYISRNNRYLSVLIAAIVCPVANTGVFLLGCFVFFMDTISAWATAAGLGGGLIHYIIFGLIGANFLFELATNIILSPIVVRLLNIKNKQA
ncbi:MAG: ECF transporter S component [Oscillospiraceae bacterium]|nr:ECF transporter S component [Oscillospiraceae bacterium]